MRCVRHPKWTIRTRTRGSLHVFVRLTHHQASAVTTRVSDQLAEAMRENRTTYGITQHDYLLPAVAWRQVLDVMLNVCLGPAGGKLKSKGRPSDSAYLAIRRIADAVKRIEAHPALRGASAIGVLPDVVPCWRTSRTTLGLPELISPYPDGLGSFSLLVPEHAIAPRQVSRTSWRPASRTEVELLAPHCRVYVEEFHLAFTDRAPDVPVAPPASPRS